ncbi:MAG: hypothetical protein FJ009_20005 [Chloroflexi bacterium]|nr:hypothetical protein [Chloroflexota bacterium]
MKFDPFKHHRRSTRLRGYDYSQAGAYFITLCTQSHECLFGDVIEGEMRLNEIGQIVIEEWSRSAEIRQEIEFDEWVVMPNHIHGIVVITTPDASARVGATGRSPLQPQQPRGPSKRSLGSFVAGFKSAATARINALRDTPGADPWQRNYHDHIIRNEREWNAVAKYIAENPANWSTDLDNPAKFPKHPPPTMADEYWRDAGLS